MVRNLVRRAGVFVVCAGAMYAQSLQVHSEFQRVGPDGRLVRPDAADSSLEILSPEVARNSWAAFHVVVKTPPGSPYHLYIGQNPADTFTTRFYLEKYTNAGGEWVPDSIEEVKLPYTSVLPQPDMPDQTVQSFFLEVFTPANLVPKRYRLEVQINVSGEWVIYPMEFRVEERTVPPDYAVHYDRMPAPGDPIDQSVLAPLSEFLCGLPALTGESPPGGTPNIRSLVRRNVEQDMAIARVKQKEYPSGKLKELLAQKAGIVDPKGWCRNPSRPAGASPEWYLRVRNFLYAGPTPI
jgi:hypothetical protein